MASAIIILEAKIAGTNCIFATHPKYVCKVPVKSKKSKVIETKQNIFTINFTITIPLNNIRFQVFHKSVYALHFLRNLYILRAVGNAFSATRASIRLAYGSNFAV